jgi:hypothetical protein
MKKFKIQIIIGAIFIGVTFLGIYEGWFAAGSYSYAQKYEFDVNASELVKRVELLKEKSRDFLTLDGIFDQSDPNGNRHIYFYDSSKDEVIHIFVDADEGNINKSDLFLVGFNKGKELGNWKIINKEYDRRENLDKKKRFENIVLEKLNLFYKDKGNAMFVFWK